MNQIKNFIHRLADSKRLQIRVLFVVALITYINIFNHDFNLDDSIIQKNLPSVEEGIAGCFQVFKNTFDHIDYRPVSLFTFSIEQLIFGQIYSSISHIINFFLFFCCAYLLFRFISRLELKHAPVIAFIATLLFIAHPIHSNVVSSIKNRDCLLSFIFGFAALNALLSYLQTDRWTLWKTIRQMLLVFIFFTIATLSKLDATSYIILLPLTFLFFAKEKLPMRIAQSFSLGYLLFFSFVLTRVTFINRVILTAEEAAKAPPIPIKFTENPLVVYPGLWAKISTAFTSMLYYLKFHFIPKGYYFFFGYDTIEISAGFTTLSWLGLGLSVVLLILFIASIKRRPIIAYGIAFFVGGLAYCLNIYQPVSGIVAPRLAFIASAGFCIAFSSAVVLAITTISIRIKKENAIKTISIVTALVLSILLIPFTISRNNVWKNDQSLIEKDIPHLEKSFEAQRIAIGYYNLLSGQQTDIRLGKHYVGKSLEHAYKASKLFLHDQYIEESILYNQFLLENYDDAFNQGKWILKNFDRSYLAMEIIGDIFVDKELLDSAAYYYEQLLYLAPEAGDPYIKHAETMEKLGKVDEAIEVARSLVGKDKQSFFPLEELVYLNLVNKDTLSAANALFLAFDNGSPNRQYGEAIYPYFKRNNILDQWHDFLGGKRFEP